MQEYIKFMDWKTITKRAIFLKSIYRFSKVPITNQSRFVCVCVCVCVSLLLSPAPEAAVMEREDRYHLSSDYSVFGTLQDTFLCTTSYNPYTPVKGILLPQYYRRETISERSNDLPHVTVPLLIRFSCL